MTPDVTSTDAEIMSPIRTRKVRLAKKLSNHSSALPPMPSADIALWTSLRGTLSKAFIKSNNNKLYGWLANIMSAITASQFKRLVRVDLPIVKPCCLLQRACCRKCNWSTVSALPALKFCQNTGTH